MLLAGGWWIAIVELWPASSRPYIGGSQNNSILELTLGYNGLGRLSGNETGSVGGGGGGAAAAAGVRPASSACSTARSAARSPGCSRPRSCSVSAALWFARRRNRRCAPRSPSGCTWLLVDRADLQLHGRHLPRLLHRRPRTGHRRARRHRRLGAVAAPHARYVATGVLAFTVALTSVFAWYLLDRADGFVPWLKWVVVVVGLVAALGPRRGRAPAAQARPRRGGRSPWWPRLAGPAAYAVSTASTPHTGSIPSAGPATAGGRGGPGGMPAAARGGGHGRHRPARRAPTQGQTRHPGPARQAADRTGGGGGMGGLLNGSTSSAAVTTLLQTDADAYTWAAAAVGANNASGYQLASEQPVMAIGGFNGSDPSPTLAQFEKYVADGQIHYFIASGGVGGGPGGTGSTQRDRPVGRGQLHRDDGRTASRSTTSRAGSSERAAAAVPAGRAGSTGAAATTVLDVVIPVYNEEAQLAASVERVLEHLRTMPWSFRVTVADNASTDQTALIARRLSHTHPEVSVVHLAEKGRGRALKRVWSASESDVLVYMDVDLSTDLAALLPLVAPLVSGHSDLAIGSRLARHSRVERGAKREFISRSYNLMLRQALRARFSDAQCGFKAIRRDAARELLPLVEDNAWFFDTELLVVAERAGLRIHEVPVDWVDDPDSSVDIVRTAVDDLKGVARLGRVAGAAAPSPCARSASGSAAPARRPVAAGWACSWASSW